MNRNEHLLDLLPSVTARDWDVLWNTSVSAFDALDAVVFGSQYSTNQLTGRKHHLPFVHDRSRTHGESSFRANLLSACSGANGKKFSKSTRRVRQSGVAQRLNLAPVAVRR